MRDLLIGPDGDLVIENRDLVLVGDPSAIAQNIRQRLSMFTNEWFIDLGEGTPWIEDILVKGQRQSIAEDILKARIRETEGVEDLAAFELAQTSERGITVTFTASTANGANIDDIVRLNL